MPEQMNPSQESSGCGVDPQSDGENKYPNLRAMGFGEILDTTFSLSFTSISVFGRKDLTSR